VFDCIGAIYIHICTWGFVNFRSVLCEQTQKIITEPSRAWMESIVGAGLSISKSQIIDMTRIIAVDQEFMLHLSFETSHFTRKATRIWSALQGLSPSSDWFDLEHIELPAKLLDYFLRSNKSNIKQNNI